MKISIFKYNKTGNHQNYFDRTSSLTLADQLDFNRQLLNSFPVFREEFSQEDDINVLKTGYFDLKLSLTMNERSTGNKTITEFFENMNPTIQNYKYVVICMTDNLYRNYSGVIEYNSVKLDLSVNENKYFLSFSVTGIEAEFVNLLKESISPNLTADKVFDTDFIKNVMVYWANPDRLGTVSLLNLQSKLGYALVIDKALFSALLLANLDPSGSVTAITSWDVFRSFLIGYGYRFKILCQRTGTDFPKFICYLYFRSEGITQSEVSKTLSEERGYIFGGDDTIAMFNASRNDGSNLDIKHKQGFIMNKNHIYITNSTQDIQHNTNYRTYTFAANSVQAVTFKEDDVTVINLDTYNANLNAGDIAICKCVAGQDINPMLQYITFFELQYLITGLKRKRNVKVKVAPESSIASGSKVTYQNRHYHCERVNSFDPFNESMEIELVQT